MDLLEQNRTYHKAQSSMELLPNYYKWTYGAFHRHITGDVVELGCGAGTGIHSYLEKTQHVYAVDHNEELLERAGRSFAPSKVTPIRADLLDDWRELQGIQADIVIMMDVLEHFRDDVDLLRKASNLLKPGGKMAIKVPAHSTLYSSIDEASGHFRRYDPNNLRELAHSVGLNCLFIRRINPFGAIAYRLKQKPQTNFSRTFSRRQLIFLNHLMPIIRLADYIPLSQGLSLICLMSNTTSGSR